MVVDRFLTIDPRGREVRLTEACYVEHIIVEHPDLTDDREIEDAIRRADLIAVDAVDRLRLVYRIVARRSIGF